MVQCSSYTAAFITYGLYINVMIMDCLAGSNFIGMVVSNAMQKTVKVKVTRPVVHPIVRKTIKSHKNYLAHDENQLCDLGDIVRIEACRPLSRRKHFTVAEIVRSAKGNLKTTTNTTTTTAAAAATTSSNNNNNNSTTA
ncbi:hypothetical protein VTP01DRAFT_1322, partial [Rhizomucor pusillus]|uniref:mitochondrial 37S ribosomal protein uS17m n=1 Tax=Rhizomucor pusillus TaxID=4840 RepID=UPI0037448668